MDKQLTVINALWRDGWKITGIHVNFGLDVEVDLRHHSGLSITVNHAGAITTNASE